MVCLLCDFKILLTVFNQSYNCQTSHYLGRNRLPNAFLMLPSLLMHMQTSFENKSLQFVIKEKDDHRSSVLFADLCVSKVSFLGIPVPSRKIGCWNSISTFFSLKWYVQNGFLLENQETKKCRYCNCLFFLNLS